MKKTWYFVERYCCAVVGVLPAGWCVVCDENGKPEVFETREKAEAARPCENSRVVRVTTMDRLLDDDWCLQKIDEDILDEPTNCQPHGPSVAASVS